MDHRGVLARHPCVKPPGDAAGLRQVAAQPRRRSYPSEWSIDANMTIIMSLFI
jgi:hypothetical protein